MTNNSGKQQLPQHPHIEHLRKEAKRRFAAMRLKASGARLADAQYWLAQEYGFSSWRALKDEVWRRMRLTRVTPAAGSQARRLHRPSDLTVEEELEAGDFFLRGAAVLQIGVICALVIVAYVMLALFVRHAYGQALPDPAQLRAEQALPRTAIAFDAAQFDKYAGPYQMSPKVVLVLSRDGNHFYACAGGQQPVEIFPESPTKFFLKAVPAQISFTLDAQGNVTGLVLHQGGHEMPALRIDASAAAAIAALPHGHPMARTWPMLAGAVPHILTTSGGDTLDYWPCFSPDGKTVLFSRTTNRGRSWTLMRISAAGGAAQPFLARPLPLSQTRADWSLDGMIAFTGTAANHSNSVWIVNADGSGAHPVTAPGSPSQLFYPSWYPDGKSVAVMDGEVSALIRMDIASRNTTPLTDPAQVKTGMPSVSPDGKSIAFAGQKNTGQPYDQEENVIWVVAGGGGTSSTLETPPLQGRAPVWSPDGKKLAFESDRGNPDGHYAAFLINRDGTGLTQVTDFAMDATHPVFSADGRHLVFAYGNPAGKASGIAVLDLSP